METAHHPSFRSAIESPSKSGPGISDYLSKAEKTAMKVCIYLPNPSNVSCEVHPVLRFGKFTKEPRNSANAERNLGSFGSSKSFGPTESKPLNIPNYISAS